jgi:hypothetical protein
MPITSGAWGTEKGSWDKKEVGIIFERRPFRVRTGFSAIQHPSELRNSFDFQAAASTILDMEKVKVSDR